MQLIKNQDGTINRDTAKYLSQVVKSYSSPSDFNDISTCIALLKNKQGKLQIQYAKPLNEAWKEFRLNTYNGNYEKFPDIIRGIEDKNGNIVPEALEELPKLFDNGFSKITPEIMKLSIFDGKFKKDNFNKALEILKNTDEAERGEISKFLSVCLDNNNNLDSSKMDIFNDIRSCGITTNILQIATALRNLNRTFSKRGLYFVKDLRKNAHSGIENDLAKILNVCRDKSGYLNNDTMHAAKHLQTLNQNLELSKLVKSTLNQNREIDNNKIKVISEILNSAKISSNDDLELILQYSADKHNVVDSNVMKRLAQLSAKGENLRKYENVIPVYRELHKYEHVSSVSQLNLRQKRTLMQALKKYENQVQSQEFGKFMSSKIMPKNSSEYCSMMGRLSHSIGINTTKLPQAVIDDYNKAMDNLADKKLGFMHLDFNKETPVLKLMYPLNDFKKDVWNIVKDTHYSDRTKALDYFGFELKNEDGNLKLTGYPSADKPDGRLGNIKDKSVIDLIKKIYPLVVKFTQNNAISIKDHPYIAKNLTQIVTAFPEFLTTIGKKQHGTHDFMLDVHLLKVLQGVMQNPEYEKLSDTSKKHIQIAALLHDITKAEGQPDFEHPRNSAFDVYYLLDKLGLAEGEKLKIYNIIKDHDWLARYDFSDEKSKRVAFNMREGNAFKLSSMLTEADLKGVQKNDRFYLKHAQKLEKAKRIIRKYLYDLQSTAIHLPQAKIPKASDLNKHSPFVTTIKADGITNTVLTLSGCDDLSKVGFKTCKSLNDFNVLVHGLDYKQHAYMFQALGLVDSDAVLNTSYVIYSKGNYRAFRNEGFILDVPDINTHAAFWRDFGSGYRKTHKDLLERYLFNDNEKRNYISDYFKNHLGLSAKEYASLYHKIEDMPLEKLETNAPKIAKTYRNLFKEMEIGKRSYGRNYNEVLVTNPKIQGIFCYDQKPESVSSYLRRYAERNNIPIIVFG